ncbi:MAG: hypothetical protein OXR62_10875 [Ahrensia sp.]|nr:hypothetical protein [Ahrensia sp.]
MAKASVEINDDDFVDEDEQVVTATAEGDADIVDEDADVSPGDELPARAVRNSDGSVTLPLLYPITLKTKKNGKVKERHFKEFRLRRLNGADRRAIAEAGDNISVVALSRMATLHMAVAQRLDELMDLADTNAVGQVLANFSTTGLKTGKRG